MPGIGFSVWKLKKHCVPFKGMYSSLFPFLCNVAAYILLIKLFNVILVLLIQGNTVFLIFKTFQ